MRPTRWRRSTHILIGATVLVLVAVVVAVAALLSESSSKSNADVVAALPPPASVQAAVVPVDDSAPKPTLAGLTSALAHPLSNPDLGTFTVMISDALSGAELFTQAADLPVQPASTNKTLTAAAALLTVDRQARLTTTVQATDQPGVIVLVGGGDPTLSSAAPGDDTLYRNAARISDLADQVKESGTKVTSIQVDISAFSGPTLAPGWDPADILGGDVAPIESIMVDGGRVQPLTPESVRSHTPALDAGRSLAGFLGVDPKAVTVVATAVKNGRQIASVESPPMIERLREMMNQSDNVMAETIGREVAVASGRLASFAGATNAVSQALKDAKIDMTGAHLLDSSGLSVDDRLTARTLDGVVTAATTSQVSELRPLLDTLPIAGGSGTLSNRYVTEPNNASAGWLRAKTGSLTGTNSLAGVVTDQSGRVLTFAMISNNAGPTGRTALDAVAGTLRSCGCGS